jgi:hypothetical protein
MGSHIDAHAFFLDAANIVSKPIYKPAKQLELFEV